MRQARARAQAGWWQLDLKLSEDQGIRFEDAAISFVSEAPLSPEFVQALQAGQRLVDFDLRPTPPQQLVAPGGAVSHVTATQDGLTIHSQCQLTEKYSLTAPTLVGKTLYVRDEKHIMALDLG